VDASQIRLNYTRALALLGLVSLNNVQKENNYHKTARVLLLGMGPGAIPRFYHHYFPDMKIEIVEINQDLVQMMVRYFPFNLEDGVNFHIHIGDAKHYVSKLTTGAMKEQKYDLVVHDVFDEKGEVAELNTVQYFNSLRTVVETSKSGSFENGIVAANFWTVNLDATREVVAKYESVFSNVRVYGVGESAYEKNCIIIAHSPKSDNNWKCADKNCEKKKGKKKSKPLLNGICANINKLVSRAAAIQEDTTNMTFDWEYSIREYWESRPFIEDDTLC